MYLCDAELGAVCDTLAEELFESEFVVHEKLVIDQPCCAR